MFEAEPLTEREQEILLLISQGMSNKEIATRLTLSAGTIKAHNHNIFSKLGVSSRTQVLLRARELGLLDETSLEPPEDHMLPAGSSVATNLPAQFTPFIGRDHELDRLADLLTDARVRLVTIMGAGGTGKSRMAVEVARQLTAHFPDGVFFVSLARVSEAGNIPAAITDDISLRYQASDSMAQQLLAYLRDKRMLLVLDNFEHLLQGAEFVAELLHAAPGVRLLVTSRERLHLSMEVLFVLSGLNYKSAAAGDPAGTSAGQLLIQRAQLINPAFELEPQDWPSVERICRLTNGMPLALILAAGWLEVLTLEEIADELSRSIDILETQFHDVPARQRSMRATIASSWHRLSAEEQQVFASLSVFRGGLSRDAACTVAGATLHQLQTLVNRSFIIASAGRYEIHELLRQYGWEQLEQAGLMAAVCAAHSAYYLDFLQQRTVLLQGHQQRAALDEIHTDFENVQAAWLWAVEHRRYDALGRAADCLAEFAEMRAFLVRVEDMLRRTVTALTPAGDEAPHPVWDQLMVRYLQTRHRLSLPVDFEVMGPIIERARARGSDHEVAYALWTLGNQALRNRDYGLHRACLEECLSIWRRLGDDFYTAHALVGICGEDMSPETSAWAIECLRESAAIRRRLGDHHALSFSLMMIGVRLMYQGALAEAELYLDECLSLQDDDDQTPDFAGVVSLKGLLAFWRGDFEAARYYAQAGIDFSQEMNFYGDKSACQALLGCVLCMEGDYARAFALCQQAMGDELFDVTAVGVQWGLVLACCGLEDVAALRQALADCLHIARDRLRSPVFQQLCLPAVAVLAARTGQPVYAVELLSMANHQPPEIAGWLPKWPLLVALRHDLENALGTESFAAAWGRGPALTLDEITL